MKTFLLINLTSLSKGQADDLDSVLSFYASSIRVERRQIDRIVYLTIVATGDDLSSDLLSGGIPFDDLTPGYLASLN